MDELNVPRRGFKLLAGTANPALAQEIAACLGVELGKVTMSRFSDGEIFVRIDENIRGHDVFIVQPTNPPAENIMELLLILDAVRRASAARTTCVMPYYGYSRQDRKDQPRVAIRREADGESDRNGGRGPSARDRFSPARAPGLFRHSGGPPDTRPRCSFRTIARSS